MCGFALLASYCLLGSAWLVMKTSDDIRDIAYKYSFRMALVTLGFAAVVSVWVPFQSPLVWDRSLSNKANPVVRHIDQNQLHDQGT